MENTGTSCWRKEIKERKGKCVRQAKQEGKESGYLQGSEYCSDCFKLLIKLFLIVVVEKRSFHSTSATTVT